MGGVKNPEFGHGQVFIDPRLSSMGGARPQGKWSAQYTSPDEMKGFGQPGKHGKFGQQNGWEQLASPEEMEQWRQHQQGEDALPKAMVPQRQDCLSVDQRQRWLDARRAAFQRHMDAFKRNEHRMSDEEKKRVKPRLLAEKRRLQAEQEDIDDDRKHIPQDTTPTMGWRSTVDDQSGVQS